MKINEETTVSEEQVLFNKLSYEEQQFILKQMRMLQPCELSCEVEEEKKIPEKLNWKPKESMAGQLTQKEQIEVIARRTEKLKKEFNNLLDYLKSKGE